MNLALSSMVASLVLLAPAKEARVPRPSDEAVAKAKSVATELYSDQITKARNLVEKTALARELVRVARETKDDPAAQYALFYVARNTAAVAKDWPLTMEAIAAIVERFQPAASLSADDQIKRGDDLCARAKNKTGRQRLAFQLWAAEYYMYAQRDGAGLYRQLAEKRLTELVESFEKKQNDNTDMKILIGTWKVQTGETYHGFWTFFPDGRVESNPDKKGGLKGTWTVGATEIRIKWNKKGWETFHRPLDVKGTTGDSWVGAGIIKAQKVR